MVPKTFGLYHTKPTTRVEKAAVKSAKIDFHRIGN
jgi:hypothetical protein